MASLPMGSQLIRCVAAFKARRESGPMVIRPGGREAEAASAADRAKASATAAALLVGSVGRQNAARA
eukprot:1092053-Lingulodinium_polyedra.AAC.1